GVFAAKSNATAKEKPDAKSSGWLEIATRVAPYVFVTGLLLALSWGVHRGLMWNLGSERGAVQPAIPAPKDNAPPGSIGLRADPEPGKAVITVRDPGRPSQWEWFKAHARADYPPLEASKNHPRRLLALFVAGVVLGVLLSWRVNINLFSLHHFY